MSIHQCVRPFLIVLTNVDVFEQVEDPVLKQICVCVDVVVCFATNLFFLYVFYGQNECILGILLWLCVGGREIERERMNCVRGHRGGVPHSNNKQRQTTTNNDKSSLPAGDCACATNAAFFEPCFRLNILSLSACTFFRVA